MNLLPREPQPLSPPSWADFLFGFVVWIVSGAVSLFLALLGVGHFLIPNGRPSYFGFELIPCLAAPVIASIAYGVALARSSIRPWPPRIAVSGALAAVVGAILTLLGYWLLVLLLPDAKVA